MIRRRLIATFLGASLIVVGGVAMSGCSDEGQPSRGSISAPRKGGGVQDTAGEKLKGKSADGAGAGKLRGKVD
jgi:hypothetical protein